MLKNLWQQIPSTVVSEILAQQTPHGVVLDTEHSSWNNETIYNCIQVIKLSGKSCYVRIAEVNKSLIKLCLDADVDGLILSNCDTTERAREFQKLVHYPPRGNRGVGLSRQNKWGEVDDILQKNHPTIIVQIETQEAIDNLNNIKKLDFDYYLIGPYDLSMSLGKVEDFYSKEYKECIQTFEFEIPKMNRAIHLPKNVNLHIEKYDDWGFLALGMDTTDLISATKENIRA
jgi:2-dehydro-3-deoxy-L-rhamnonate aldolase